MKLLVVNCNTSHSTTAAIGRAAQSAASPATEVVATQPSWGVESAEGFLDSFISAAAVLDTLSIQAEGFDAVVLAGYGEHGREGARQLLDIPVVDITEASAQLACLIGYRYGVVTTLGSTLGAIEDSLQTAGLLSRCVGVEASDIPVLDLSSDIDRTAVAIAEKAELLISRGADVLVLGCAGMGGLKQAVETKVSVPVIDSVGAGVALAEALVGQQLTTSKVGPYAPASATKIRPGWPVTSRA